LYSDDAESTHACDHLFHKECLRDYILTNINDGKTDLKCPAGCEATTAKKRGKLTSFDFKKILSAKEFDKWD
jgi:hypothetical protein